MLSVFDCVLNVVNESVCDWKNALNYQLYFYVINGCVAELYFRTLFQLGKNVMDKWYEWLCDWDLF